MATIPNGVHVAGSLTPIQGDLYITQSKSGGGQWQRRYRGLHDQVLAVFNKEARNFSVQDCYYQQQGAIGEAVFTYNTTSPGIPEIIQERLDLDWQEHNGSIFGNPTFQGITPARAAQIVAAARYSTDEPHTTAQITAKEAELSISTDPNNVERRALNLLKRGQNSYTWTTPILTYTRTVSPGSTVSLAITNQGLVGSSADVIDYIGGKARLFVIPATPTNTGIPDGFTAGWMKKCRLSWIANGNIDLVETFAWGVFANDLYPRV